MYIKPEDKTIQDLLLSKRQFFIPRFQREYSWDKKNYQEFFLDILNGIKILENGEISREQYFLGTMLFIGSYTEGNDRTIQVVDGQQRLTTITILFSAIAQRFTEIKETKLSERIFEYIMTQDDDGNDVRILKSNTHYPYFAYFIQDRFRNYAEQEPNSEEEKCIYETYNYFYNQLDEVKLKDSIKKLNNGKFVDMVKYVELLKSIRDQVLQSVFVSISTTDKTQANLIFEILNAKGKRLAHIDLIKNKIFEKISKVEPADFATEEWNKIKRNINSSSETLGLATFFRHFWISKYKKSSNNSLYDDFNKLVKTSKDCEKLLREMVKASECYVKILNPRREDYGNRKEYYWLVQSLKVLNNYFNIIQVRIVMLALFDAKEREIISSKLFKSTVIFLENFHFVYNAITSKKSNRFESIYSKFSISLHKCTDKTAANFLIQNDLIKPLINILPQYDEFEKEFIALRYSSKRCATNMKSKYIIYKINSYMNGYNVFDDQGSIEHIICETKDEYTTNIGNLIVLESNLNHEADNKTYDEKRTVYFKSKYKEVQEFVNNNNEWTEELIYERAKQLSKFYYEKILKFNELQLNTAINN